MRSSVFVATSGPEAETRIMRCLFVNFARWNSLSDMDSFSQGDRRNPMPENDPATPAAVVFGGVTPIFRIRNLATSLDS